MPRSDDLYTLPNDLPVPTDDGACRHLPGLPVPVVLLPSSSGGTVNVHAASMKRAVVFCYPRTGRPDVDPPPGWNAIPGARGCTPQTCAFRDRSGEFGTLGVRLFGLSTQSTADQREAAERLKLPFPLLSDARLQLAKHLSLPTFEVEGATLIKRLTLVLGRGRIETVFYPVFPPDQNADDVLAWLRANPPQARA